MTDRRWTIDELKEVIQLMEAGFSEDLARRTVRKRVLDETGRTLTRTELELSSFRPEHPPGGTDVG